MTEYKGPNHLKDDIQLALSVLTDLLSANIDKHEHHSVIQIEGFDHREQVIQGVSVYLVGAIASCIEFNLNLRKALFEEDTINRDLKRDVISVVGEDNNIDDNRKIYERNPWLWEGLSHLLLHLSQTSIDTHPPGALLAKTSVHLDVKDHGLDIIALYGSNELGITAGECKAYLNRSAAAVVDAATRLQEVDKKLRDAEIRSALIQFRSSLLPEQQEKIAGAFWHNKRSYFPMVCCDSDHATDWSRKRKAIKRLEIPSRQKFLLPVAIDEADEFFDAVSDEMRRYANIVDRSGDV